MEGICKKRGFALVTSIFIMLLMLTLGLYATSFVLTEMKISGSQSNSVKTYYLAESGIAEAIWRIKNDAAWKSGFEGSAAWTIDYTRNSVLYPAGSYRIQITNSEKAKGNIIVTATLGLDGTASKRVVKTSVFKAIGDSVIGQNGEFADGNIDMSGSNLHVYNGGFFSNGNIIINYHSEIVANGAVNAVGNIILNQSSHITASSTHASNGDYIPAPDPIAMPAVSFDGAGDPQSYKARASQTYTAAQFSNMLFSHRETPLTLNGIIYVTGAVDIYGANDLVINGALVADGNITVGKDTHDCCSGSICENKADIIINNPDNSTSTGLISKGRINFESCLGSFTGKGLIYSNDVINVLSLPNQINITGALVGRKITLTSAWQGVNITYDNSVVNYGLGSALFSPIVTVEHWEEEY